MAAGFLAWQNVAPVMWFVRRLVCGNPVGRQWFSRWLPDDAVRCRLNRSLVSAVDDVRPAGRGRLCGPKIQRRCDDGLGPVGCGR